MDDQIEDENGQADKYDDSYQELPDDSKKTAAAASLAAAAVVERLSWRNCWPVVGSVQIRLFVSHCGGGAAVTRKEQSLLINEWITRSKR